MSENVPALDESANAAYAEAALRRPWMRFYGESEARLAPPPGTALDLFRAVGRIVRESSGIDVGLG